INLTSQSGWISLIGVLGLGLAFHPQLSPHAGKLGPEQPVLTPTITTFLRTHGRRSPKKSTHDLLHPNRERAGKRAGCIVPSARREAGVWNVVDSLRASESKSTTIHPKRRNPCPPARCPVWPNARTEPVPAFSARSAGSPGRPWAPSKRCGTGSAVR